MCLSGFNETEYKRSWFRKRTFYNLKRKLKPLYVQIYFVHFLNHIFPLNPF